MASASSSLQIRRDLCPRAAVPHLWALAAVAIATGLSWTAHGLIADESLSMVFLSAVLVSSVVHGRNVGLVAALTAFLSYNILVLEPRFSFRFAPLSDILTLAVFSAVALLTGGLAGRVRDQARAMSARASTMATLFRASQALARPASRDELVSILADQVAAAIESRAYVFMRSGEGVALAAIGSTSADSGDVKCISREELAAYAEQAWSRLGATGDSAPAAPLEEKLSVFPLGSLRQPMGLLVCERPIAGVGRWMDDQSFAVFCELGAIALERACLVQEMTKAQVLAEKDRLRTALLSSISHDFRTPLSGILASATALIQQGRSFNAKATAELLANVRDQAERMNRYVANLLDMIKLESGSIAVKLEPTDAIDIIASASRRCGNWGGAEEQGWLRCAFPGRACLVEADPVLLEQAIFNVLENALAYSPAGSLVEVSLHASLHVAEIVVADEGPGIPCEDLERVFDKFLRVSNDQQAIEGTGLGLSICRGLIEAMGGTVHAVSPLKDGRGTAIHICLRRVADA